VEVGVTEEGARSRLLTSLPAALFSKSQQCWGLESLLFMRKMLAKKPHHQKNLCESEGRPIFNLSNRAAAK
jgi:hypothetical protein